MLLVAMCIALGACPAARGAATPEPAASTRTDDAVVVELYTRTGCPHCSDARAFLQTLSRERSGIRVVVRPIDRDVEARRALERYFREAGITAGGVPAFVVRGQVLVGGQMLNIPDRSTLHAMGEVFDRRAFIWRAADGTEPEHDLARHPLRTTGWLHRRIDVDYNAWWMCVIPRTAAERLGLPLPLFIKWGDCEYGLRAKKAGYPTVTLPGGKRRMSWST